ncbi:hypothetical protein [Ancylomarina longa]|uniref:Uncharacterized protein n=1 Tax=Ancylomarina longa TaxID=2487017 RepID=A0A434AEW2_9BACT|nr:hypothetical protein [Ancylomarina longa]RUT72941.1 hypothetical protein DLK05_15895 [Ancylomarina longa]
MNNYHFNDYQSEELIKKFSEIDFNRIEQSNTDDPSQVKFYRILKDLNPDCEYELSIFFECSDDSYFYNGSFLQIIETDHYQKRENNSFTFPESATGFMDAGVLYRKTLNVTSFENLKTLLNMVDFVDTRELLRF